MEIDDWTTKEIVKNAENLKATDSYKAGEFLIKNGTASFGAFYICSGKIELIYKNEEDFLVKETKITGDVVGLDNLEVDKFVFDAVALVDTEVCFFNKDFLLNELEDTGY